MGVAQHWLQCQAHLALTLLGQLVDQGGAGDGLARAGGPLDETEGRLQHRLDSIHL